MIEFYPLAVQIPGPAWKQGYGIPAKRFSKGAMVHSAEGEWAGMLARLLSTDEVSWIFSILTSGVVIQHFPLSAICWHGGSRYPNERWFGVECEGRAGEVLTPQQKTSLVNLLLWAKEQENWSYIKLEKYTGTLGEHNWYYPTACPSGRIPWQEIIMAMTKIEELERLFQMHQAVLDKDEVRLRALEGYRPLVQAVMDDHEHRLEVLEPKK